MITNKTTAAFLFVFSAFSGSTISAEVTTVDDDFEFMLGNLPGMGSRPPDIGSNVDGGSVFTNYIKARKDGEFFLLWQAVIDGSSLTGFRWCRDLDFSDISDDATDGSMVGYSAKCLGGPIASTDLTSCTATTATQPSSSNVRPLTADDFNDTNSLSMVYITQSNIFEGEYHSNANDWIVRFWDDGRPTSLEIDWMTSKSFSFSSNGKQTWISATELACLLGDDVSGFTPKAFTEIYKEVLAKTLGTNSTTSTDSVDDEADGGGSESDQGDVDGVDEAAGPSTSNEPSSNDGGESGAPPNNGRRLSISAIPGIVLKLFGW